MEDTMKVMELLEELEDIVDAATNVPLTSSRSCWKQKMFSIL